MNVKKQISDFFVERNVSLGDNFVQLHLYTHDKLPEINPGQFVQIQIPSSIHGWLRIPVSIHDAEAEKGKIKLLVQKVGGWFALDFGLARKGQAEYGSAFGKRFQLAGDFVAPRGGRPSERCFPGFAGGGRLRLGSFVLSGQMFGKGWFAFRYLGRGEGHGASGVGQRAGGDRAYGYLHRGW